MLSLDSLPTLAARPHNVLNPASLWKLRPQSFQDEYGQQAPTVTKPREMNSQIGGGGSRVTSIPTSVAQEAWLSAALEELAQMCGALLRATATSNADSSVGSRLSINVHVGDALNFCDALLTCASPAGGSADGDAPKESATRGSPVAFQQDTLQPLHLRAGAVTEFDVISSSNLADYLGRLLQKIARLCWRFLDPTFTHCQGFLLVWKHTCGDGMKEQGF